MTVREAIERLQKIEAKNGGDTELFFDCPFCAKSFTPNTAVTQAVHLTSTVKEGRTNV